METFEAVDGVGLESETETETETEFDSVAGAEYAEPGTEGDFLVKRAAWERGELDEADLPMGAISYDTLDRKLIFGRYAPKIGRDVDRGVKRSPAAMGSTISPNWKPSVTKPLPSVRCIKIKKDGERCNRWSIRGATICITHGGNLPNVKQHAAAAVETARMRLIDLTDDAVTVLEELTAEGTAPAIRLKAATEILDRAGIKGGMEIDVVVEHKIDASKSIADKLGEIMARSRAKGELESGPEDIVDAEVVDES